MFEKDVAESLFDSDPDLARDVVKELKTGWRMQAVNAEINTRKNLQEAKVKHESSISTGWESTDCVWTPPRIIIGARDSVTSVGPMNNL